MKIKKEEKHDLVLWGKKRFGRWEQALVGAAVKHALRDQIAILIRLDLYHKSLDSGELQYKPGNRKITI